MSCVEKQNPKRPLVADVNPALMCRLCGGYYVDAAAIIECLHAFCKSCLVRYLETNKYCPICEVQVHKSRPLQNIRLDPTLQDMVYKLVPGLYHKEMKCRREFYSSRPNAPSSSEEDRGEIPPELCPFYTPDEPVSLVLEYRSPEIDSDHTSNIMDPPNKRFLRCPAAVKITHLEKLLRNKYGLDNRYNIDLMLEDSKLCPDLTLMDVAYAFGRKRKGQFLFTYRIYDTQCKKMRLSGDCEMDTLPPPEIKVEAKNEPGTGASVTKLSSAEPIAPTTSTTTCVVTSLPAPVVTTPAVTKPLSSAPVGKSLSLTVTPAVPSVTPATSSVTPATLVTPSVAPATSVTLMTPVTPATSVAARVTPAPPTVTPAALTITPVTSAASVTVTATSTVKSSARATASIPVSASTSITTTAPSLTVSVQRLNPATVKSVTSPPVKTMPEKTQTVISTDRSNKLDSIISRLGDPSKHSRPESNSVAASKKEFRKPQGKEVQLRISENGEMITNVVNSDKNDKTSSSHPKTTFPPIRPKPTPNVSHSAKTFENSSSESAPKQGAVAPVSPGSAASPRKSGYSPVGYKTLKSGPKNWNPTITRDSFLSAKLEQQQQQQQQLQRAQQLKDNSSPGGPTKSPAAEPVAKPPKFFKARNTPRYLGNPASGVKPMYQVASSPPPVEKEPSKPPVKPPSKPAALLKLDPKTLTPIMTSTTSAASVASPPPQTTQVKTRPPFLSTTISGSHNHSPSSRGVTTTSTATTVTENSSKMSSPDVAMRNTPPPHPYMRLFSYCDPLNPPLFSPRLGDPSRIPSSPPYANLLRPFSPLLVNSYGLGRPPVGMLYNQALHRQVNHSGPLSPVPGLPSPLPPTSAPLSPSSTPKNVMPPVQWGPASPSSPASQSKVPSSPSAVPMKLSAEVQPKAGDKQTKVNGEKSQVKDKSAKKIDEVPVKPVAEVEKKEGEAKATSVKENTKGPRSSEQDNNNTVVIDKKSIKLDESVEQSQPLSHNISKLCSPTPPPPPKGSSPSKVENASADQVAIKQS